MQTCKACGKRDKFNFHVPDDVWDTVVPLDLRSLVVCLECFDGFAASAKVSYADSIDVDFYFVGDAATLLMQIQNRIPS